MSVIAITINNQLLYEWSVRVQSRHNWHKHVNQHGHMKVAKGITVRTEMSPNRISAQEVGYTV
jgi:hypothetical protein